MALAVFYKAIADITRQNASSAHECPGGCGGERAVRAAQIIDQHSPAFRSMHMHKSRRKSPREVHLEYCEDDRNGVNHDKASHNPVGRSVLVYLWPRGRWVREVGQKRVQAKKEQADRQKAMHRIFYTESR